MIEGLNIEQQKKSDLLTIFSINKKKVLLYLKITNPQGKNIFYKGQIEKVSDLTFIIKDRDGDRVLNIDEIKDDGIREWRYD